MNDLITRFEQFLQLVLLYCGLDIKRLKSLLDIDRLRARKESDLAEPYLQGKLLYAAVVEKIARRRFGKAQLTLAIGGG